METFTTLEMRFRSSAVGSGAVDVETDNEIPFYGCRLAGPGKRRQRRRRRNFEETRDEIFTARWTT